MIQALILFIANNHLLWIALSGIGLIILVADAPELFVIPLSKKRNYIGINPMILVPLSIFLLGITMFLFALLAQFMGYVT